MEFIDLKAQYQLYESEIDFAIKEVLQDGQFIMGKKVYDLEEALAREIGVKCCVATSSGTDSLLLALTAIGIEAGDEVICVPYTWISPVEVIRRLKAVPVFVDIDPDTYMINVNQLEEAITKKTKAIIPISLYGQMPDFEKLNAIATKYNIAVIEDAAQSFGATQNGTNSCNASFIGVTSFFPTKPLGCYGDGGALFTNDSNIANKIRALRVHGASERYNHQYIGMNGRIDTLQAAILLAKLPFFKEELKKRTLVGEYYSQRLKGDFVIPKVVPGNTHIYSQYVLRSENRDEVLTNLKKASIPAAIYYPICIHEQPAYLDLGYKRGDFPVAEKTADEVFSIPMHPWLTKENQEIIINVLKLPLLQTA
ncbi:MAG: UDP-2-acetamido-2-deoxy-3-oxo-D-glucuronate aminotransferase [Chlamydiae bacterium]|nr:UDP-2-acetamido-2-deoxy-3-oxo-D-glucuronate aminotransferase [Chlamydiota bacterium]